MSGSPEWGGADGPGLFSPADFADADELRPTAAVFDLGGNGSATPYTAAVNGLLIKHVDELKQKAAASVSIPTGWKKRLRDFLSAKNTQLLDFLSLSIPSHPTLGKGEMILRKFGNVNLHANHPTVRDLVLDSSGVDVTGEIAAGLVALRTADGMKDYIAGVRYIQDQYREAGEEALRQEQAFRAKIETLDKLQGRLSMLFDLDPTEKYQPLMEVTEEYLETVFKKNQIEEGYRAFITAYRKFLALREVVLMTRAITAQECEPLCTICLQESIGVAMVPCGHTFCMVCARKQVGACFVCRGVVRDKVKLFFG
jgi:hypothetical protein